MKTCPGREISMDLISGSHSIGQNLYHLEWCPKYRYNMFTHEENKNLCEEILHDVANRHQIRIDELSVMPDHIHAVVERLESKGIEFFGKKKIVHEGQTLFATFKDIEGNYIQISQRIK